MSEESPKFDYLTLIEAVRIMRRLTQAKFEEQMLYLALDMEKLPRQGMSVDSKANLLVAFAKENASHPTASGEPLVEEIVKRAAGMARPDEDLAFARALSRDGFTLSDDGVVVSTLPPEADLTGANDELHSLLDELDMVVAKNHLDQAIQNHAVGNWASANGQLRPFLEELLNEISRRLDTENADAQFSSENRRARLAAIEPPFLVESLGEWSTDGKNFINGVFKKLNPEGPHPGPSNEEDCTLRLHLALIVGRHYLRRAIKRIKSAQVGG